MDVIIQTDDEADAAYIGLFRRPARKGIVKRTLRVDADIALDFDGKNRLMGIDVMSASTRLAGRVSEVRIDQLVGVKESAAIIGVRPPNFVRDHADDVAFPRPVVTLASGRIWLRSQVEAYARTRASRRGAKRAS